MARWAVVTRGSGSGILAVATDVIWRQRRVYADQTLWLVDVPLSLEAVLRADPSVVAIEQTGRRRTFKPAA